MVRLNARAEIDKVPFADVAREFLGRRSQAAAAFWSALFAPDFGRLLVRAPLAGLRLAGHGGAGRHSARPARGPGRWLAQPVLVFTGLLQTIPSLALLAFLIPVTGTIGVWPALIALFLYALLPITRNTHTGLVQVPRGLVQAAPRWGCLREHLMKVELPLAAAGDHGRA